MLHTWCDIFCCILNCHCDGLWVDVYMWLSVQINLCISLHPISHKHYNTPRLPYACEHIISNCQSYSWILSRSLVLLSNWNSFVMYSLNKTHKYLHLYLNVSQFSDEYVSNLGLLDFCVFLSMRFSKQIIFLLVFCVYKLRLPFITNIFN